MSLLDLPELDCFVVCGEDKVCRVMGAREPCQLVDFFVDF